jgi:ATP-dependent exoDNAse (exonuclease V) beta subunit
VVPLVQVIEDFAYVPLIKKVRWAAWALGLLQQVSPEGQDCVAAYWQALERYASSNPIFAAAEFTSQLAAAHGSVLSTAANPIQIMTIHKSKGLEFDHVFIPFAEKTGALDDNPLLQVQPVVFEQGEGLLIAALPDRVEDTGPHLYQYLRYLNREKGLQELKRVLYVAVTRGKKSVTLLSKISVNTEQESARSARADAFLSSLMESLTTHERESFDDFVSAQSAQPDTERSDQSSDEAAETDKETGATATSEEKPWLYSGLPQNADLTRLDPAALLPWEQVIAAGHTTAYWSQALAEWAGPAVLSNPLAGQCPAEWRRKRGNSTAATGELLAEIIAPAECVERECGVYLHGVLERYPTLSALSDFAKQGWQEHARAVLDQAGVRSEQIEACCERLQHCLRNLCTSDRGRWIMAARESTRVEWPLAVHKGDGVKQLRVDRCFFEDQCFWIIDFKLSQLAHQSDAVILSQYGAQMQGYVEAILAGWGGSEPSDLVVRYGLYFPETDRWVCG